MIRALSFSVIYLLLFFFVVTNIFAQGEAGNWYFGVKAGIKFMPGSVQPVSVSNNAMGALPNREGTASISDCAGNLLFYTGGDTIWNKNHFMMENGDSIGGGWSSMQGAIIIPQPNSDSIYYIFTIDHCADTVFYCPGLNGFRYAIVNMNKNSGLGAVVSKSNNLLSKAEECLTGVHHANGKDIWIVAHGANSDSFYTYLLSDTGVSVPVISKIGPSFNSKNSLLSFHKFSPDGKWLAKAHLYSKEAGLYNFNDTTGQLTNYQQLPVSPLFSLLTGLSFSPQSSKLYLNDLGALYQFDMKATNIPASKTLIANSILGGLQLAPDCKLYIATGSDSLSVINNPDGLGINCGFVRNQFGLSASLGGTALLPVFIESYFKGPQCINANFGFSGLCKEDTIFFYDSSMASINNLINYWSWNFGDSASMERDTSSLQNPYHIYHKSGSYAVMLIIKDICSYHTDTIVKIVDISWPSLELGNDTSLCFSEGDSFQIDAGNPGLLYSWSTLDTTQVITVDTSGNYFVIVTDSNNCTDTGYINIIIETYPLIDAGPNDTVEIGDDAILIGSIIGNSSSYHWLPETYLNNAASLTPLVIAPSQTTTYYLFATTPNGCEANDSVIIFVRDNSNISIPKAFSPNNDGKNDFFIPIYKEITSLLRFEIYDRWGKLIFKTTDLNEGWDGRYKGIKQENGAYKYFVEGHKLENTIIYDQGTLILVN